jgi:hypothetical protein
MPTGTSAAELSVSVSKSPQAITFRWRAVDDDARDPKAAEAERPRDEGKHATLTAARPSNMRPTPNPRTRTEKLIPAQLRKLLNAAVNHV